MTIEDVAFNLANAAVREAAAAVKSGSSLSGRPQAYLNYEHQLLAMALDAAEETPDLEREIWGTVWSSVCELNDHLFALGVPELKFVNYAIFNAWVAWRLDRSQVEDDLEADCENYVHFLH